MNDFSAFHGPNAGYVLELYDRYRADPQSVDADMRAFFQQWSPPADEQTPSVPQGSGTTLDITRTVGAARLIRYIREQGHLDAHIDPLGSPPRGALGLHMDIHGVDEAFLASLPASIVRGPLAAKSHDALEGVQKLREAYSGSIGYETDHIQIFEERAWLRDAIEDRRFFSAGPARKRELL